LAKAWIELAELEEREVTSRVVFVGGFHPKPAP
jgi:hypothetical protein